MILSDKFIPNPVAVIEEFLEESISGSQVATLTSELSVSELVTVPLDNVLVDLPTSLMVFKIEDEIMIGSISGSTLTLIGNARPTFGTVVAIHASSIPVFLATFSDCISKVYNLLADDYKNDIPGVIYTMDTDGFNDDTGVQSVRVNVKIYGGEDLSKKHPRYYAQIINGLWLERIRDFKQKRFTSGMIGSVQAEGGGQLLLDTISGIPSWPFVLTFVMVEIL